MTAYYNEFEPFAARWLENLAAANHIAPGAVDARSISEVRPADLVGVTQAHFFAGIGVWSYALRLAGWPDDAPVWTGSCPCQPFSSAGEGKGFDDERHLWPVWFPLIRECRPPVVFGEQVASTDGLAWLDAVSADLEGEGYAFAAADLCAAGVGAPHIRQRLFFVAYARDERREGLRLLLRPEEAGRDAREVPEASRGGGADGVADANQQHGDGGRCGAGNDGRKQRSASDLRGGKSLLRGMADAADIRLDGRRTGEARDGRDAAWVEPQRLRDAGGPGNADAAGLEGHGGPRGDADSQGRSDPQRHGPTAGFWGDAEWVHCRDGKWRPTEPGTFPLAHGAPSRVGRLRAYGNAINAEVAAKFIEAAAEAMKECER